MKFQMYQRDHYAISLARQQYTRQSWKPIGKGKWKENRFAFGQ